VFNHFRHCELLAQVCNCHFKKKLSMKRKIVLCKLIVGASLCLLTSCNSFLDIDPPKTQVARASVFSNEATATSALAGMYYQMATSGFASGDQTSVTVVTGLSSDELINYSSSVNRATFASNSLLPRNTILSAIWASAYKTIYAANTIIEGVASSDALTPQAGKELTGEAKFIRAFCHFYLTTLFGEVPIVTATDYRINATISRSEKNRVIEHIILDLTEAEAALPLQYVGLARSRPNKRAAQALLARVYLYNQQWELASSKATEVIVSPDYELLENLDEVFLATSREAIWQLTPSFPGLSTLEGNTFILSNTPRVHSLSQGVVDAFEPGDMRRTNWIGTFVSAGTTYYYPYKYKEFNSDDPQEASMVLRLAELYLIRAEAKAQSGDLAGAVGDVNTLRSRAGASLIDATVSKNECLNVVQNERRCELFTEWGHRWLDLIRTGVATEVLSPLKNPNWQSTDEIYPVPQDQIDNNPNIKQNPGY
jgi:hypothetical protein